MMRRVTLLLSFLQCFAGPGILYPLPVEAVEGGYRGYRSGVAHWSPLWNDEGIQCFRHLGCLIHDSDGDRDVDLRDLQYLQTSLGKVPQ